MNENLPTESTTKARATRRNAAFGVAAGLLAGGAIGLAVTVPSLTSAASDDPVLTDDAVAALQDTGDETTDSRSSDSTTDETSSDGAVEPGQRLRAALQPLVDDGTITAVQADAVATHLVENRPERGEGHGRHGRLGRRLHGTVVADAIGIDVETLREELQSGKSIADVAEENGVDVQTVVDALVADAQGHIDLAIEHGLDEEAAAERLAEITERIEAKVNEVRGTDEG